jgi:predicted DsbA family dithiol-disulfide isomerase
MLIEIWSDVVCPWCYIGKRRLEAALAAFPHADEVEVVYRSFELDPTAPEVGTESIADALARKYGMGADGARAAMQQVGDVAAEEGLRFDYAMATHTKTVDAHRLLHLALAQGGPVLQYALSEELLAAYFVQAENVADHDLLRRTAEKVGLDSTRVEAVLAGSEYADAVEADIREATALGANGVPFFVIDRKYGISGAQPAETFVQVLEKAWSDTHPQLEQVGQGADGEVCGPDGCPI